MLGRRKQRKNETRHEKQYASTVRMFLAREKSVTGIGEIQKESDNMTELGIVRSVDELGRVIIPKEIRRTLGIHEGDQMSISVDGDSMIFRKVPKYVAPLKLLDDVIRDLDDNRWSNKKAEAMQFLRAAKEILEAEGR